MMQARQQQQQVFSRRSCRPQKAFLFLSSFRAATTPRLPLTPGCPSSECLTTCRAAAGAESEIATTGSTSSSFSSAAAVDLLRAVDLLHAAAQAPGSVPPSFLLFAALKVEKAKPSLLPGDYFSTLSAPGKRWQLVWTADSKAVQAASKGTPPRGFGGAGLYFPIPAVQKFNAEELSFENGVFLGPLLGHLTFKGPCMSKGKQLSFDVTTMYVGLGPWRVPVTLKKDAKPLAEVDQKNVKALPFFIYAYVDDQIVLGRGRSGGLALWVSIDPAMQAATGALNAFK